MIPGACIRRQEDAGFPQHSNQLNGQDSGDALEKA